MPKARYEQRDRAICDAPCPACGYKDLHTMTYACGIVILECPKCEAKGSGCTIGGAYSNMKTTAKSKEDRDTRTKAAMESIAHSLELITEYLGAKHAQSETD